MLAFMDVATRRVRAELVMIEGKGGVRNTDGIKAFLAMAVDPAWGLPKHFYVDNGSEYLFSDYLSDAIALTRGGGDRGVTQEDPRGGVQLIVKEAVQTVERRMANGRYRQFGIGPGLTRS